MSDRIFGTDGVRGIANTELTPELAFRLGRAGAAVVAREAAPEAPIIVGRDTRLSGTMLEAAIIAGITSVGRNVIALGIVPTPAVAAITRLTEAAAGVMITASHNPIEDNGIKFFAPDGFKLPDDAEHAIEHVLDAADLPRPTHAAVGVARSAPELVDRYVATLLEAGADLSGLTVVVDAAHGAAHAVAARALRTLGACVIELHSEPDGSRINVGCGATDLRPLRERVRELAAAERDAHVIGIAFDGDADRVLFVDEAGEPKSGDHVMLILGRELHARGRLAHDTVVGTVMSNVGLELALREAGIALRRAPVGDRYVVEEMRAAGYTFGGEQSGHVVDLSRNTTGDGPMTAISLLSTIARHGATLRELAADLRVYPQVLVNVRTHRKEILASSDAVRAAVDRTRAALAVENGRLLVRPSGTEPLIRVMLEGEDADRIERFAHDLAAVIRVAAEA